METANMSNRTTQETDKEFDKLIKEIRARKAPTSDDIVIVKEEVLKKEEE